MNCPIKDSCHIGDFCHHTDAAEACYLVRQHLKEDIRKKDLKEKEIKDY